MSDESPVFDPQALEEAEAAARAAQPGQSAAPGADETPLRADEPWVKVASAASGDLGRSLEAAFEVLREVGIPVGFDPYRPGVGTTPYGQASRMISLVVPESFERQAREALREARVWLPGEPPPEGTTVGAAIEHREPPMRRRDSHPWIRIAIAVTVVVLLLAALVAGLAAGVPLLFRQ